MIHPDLAAENEFVQNAYARLAAMRDIARMRMEEVLDLGRGGTPQSRAERDVVVRSSLARLDALNVGEQALVFGRIDFQEASGEFDGASFHIGRLSVNGEDMEPLVVDWRAPVSEAFYRATGKDPMGLRLRRHLLCRGPKVVGIEDEALGSDEQFVTDESLIGAGALYAAISRPRTEYMADIVATIQGEQDAIVRHPMSGVLVVQGAPGTGKTAVALHRAAYLLYTYRWRFEHQGLLVVGPSTEFVRYISRVLPSLGESGVELKTIEGVSGLTASRAESSALAVATKGDVRMAEVIAKGVKDRERALRKVVEVPFGSKILKVPPELTARIVNAAKRRSGPHNSRRRLVEHKLAEVLAQSYLQDGPLVAPRDPESNVVHIGARVEEVAATPLPGEDGDVLKEVIDALRHSQAFQRVVERIWPRLTAFEFLYDLLAHRPLLELAAKGILSDRERDAIAVTRQTSVEEHRWSHEDLMLLDEARVLLEGDDEITTFGHVVIDEAQDLSPMAARMIARRCPGGSMTVLGDIAQAMGPWAGRDWASITLPLRNGREFELVELTVNYRTPAEISAVADVVRARYLPEYRASKSIREGARPPRYLPIARGTLLEELRGVIGDLAGQGLDGTIGIVAPTEQVSSIVTELESLDEMHRSAIAVLDVGRVRGLEFDHVVIVEPFVLIRDPERAMRALFVAVTRATQSVTFLGSDEVPDWLEPTIFT